MSDGSQVQPALTPLQRTFIALEDARARLAAAENAAREPIAVVGLGCRLPGAENPEAFWRLLSEGREAIASLPADRWDVEALYDADPETPGRIAARGGGFLKDVSGFDPAVFGITRREADSMDPQQRLLLEVAWESLENAGYPPDRQVRTSTGVYIGIAGNDYATMQMKTGDNRLLDGHFASGIAHSVVSGRLSYMLGLQGPSLSIDTACSSSLVAVHLACQALRARDCRMALAGGVNLILSPDIFIALSRARMLAPDGRCKTFDAAADGFARGEGCGLVVLKRLGDAVADGDRVLAIIRGSAVNQDGASSGLTAPSGPAQRAVIREALERAGVQPRQVGYVEAHGTGTQLGDPLELRALQDVFGPDRTATARLVIGSVKTNIGHVEAAAGIAGLIKLILSLQNGEIPAHLNLHTPTPHIDWEAAPFVAQTRLGPWEPIDGRRIAGVSSFGFSGTNAHIVVEQAPPVQADPSLADEKGSHLFILSAHNERALAELARRHVIALENIADRDLANLCFAVATSRASFPHRAAIVTRSIEELRGQLEAVANGTVAAGVRRAKVRRRDAPRIAFLFTGQGSQYAGMAESLDRTQPSFRSALDRCAAALDPHLGRPLRHVLFPAPGETSPIDDTEYTQPALFAVEYALSELLRHWGVSPDIVMGHSVGEYVAACTAGVLSLEDALALVAERGRLMQSLPAGGVMAAIFESEAEVAKVLESYGGSVSIAALNEPAQTVISGTAAAVKAACDAFAARGVRCNTLAVSHAFHSPLVDPILDAFEKKVAAVPLAAPERAFISNLTGKLADARDVVRPAYWRKHVREPVRFVDGVQALVKLDAEVCIEIGPNPVLLAFVQQTLGERAEEIALIPTLRRSRSDTDQLIDVQAALFLAGATLDWRAVWSATPRQLVDLPTYPFQRVRCWFNAQTRPQGSGRDSGHPLLGLQLRSAASDLVSFELQLHHDSVPFLLDHQVNGRAILPATGFIEMALAASRIALGDRPGLRDVVIAEPLAVSEGETRIVQVLVRRDERGGKFEILSTDALSDDDAWRKHVEGHFGAAQASPALEPVDAIRGRCTEQVASTDHYSMLAARGLVFGPSLRGLLDMRRRDGEALGEIALPDEAGVGNYGIHPALLDACLQVVSAALPSSAGEAGRAYLPLAIDNVELLRSPSGQVWSHAFVEATGLSGSLRGEVSVFDNIGLVARLHGITFRPAATTASVDESSFYRTVWEPRSTVSSEWVPEPARLAQTAARSLNDLFQEHDIDSYDRGYQALETWCGSWIVDALTRLGWAPAVGSQITPQSLVQTLGIAPRYERLLARYLRILGEDGLLAPSTDGWSVISPLTATNPAEAMPALLAAHPSSRARITLAASCGAELAAILRGDVDPLTRLFPNGSTEMAEDLYRNAPEARALNGLVRETVRDVAACRPLGARLRMLEVGGGTGGTTTWVAPILPDQTDYLFTDLGPSMVSRAREAFAAFPFMDFKVFDLEQDAGEQGIGLGYDLILASNVIHATADLSKTLARLRSLLAPGGMILMLEAVGDERWVDLTFGLTDGWWRFTDSNLRNGSPLLSRERWLALLSKAGFEAEALNRDDKRTRQALFSARRPDKDDMRQTHGGAWAILSDTGGVGQALAQRIASSGGPVHMIAGPADLARLPADLKGVIHLRSLDLPRLDDAGLGTSTLQQKDSLGSLIDLVQALGRATFAGVAPRLWMASRGGQSVEDFASADPAQAVIWGFGRTIALEHAELRPTLVDLDPAADPPAAAGNLFDCLAAADAEDQIAIRGQTQFVARLVKGAGPTVATPARLEKGGHGIIDELQLVPTPRRAPGPGEVEIRVAVAGLNFRDVMNAVAVRNDPEPLGGECAGRIVAVGEGVQGLGVGDHVVGLAAASFATYATTSASLVAKIPDGLSFAEAATLPFCFMTAHHALSVLGRLKPGETVLIQAGAGGVGIAAIQIALGVDARVLATAGSDEKRAFLMSLGVEAVFNSRDLAFADEVLALTGGRGVDVVLNSLAGEFISASVRALSPNGRFLEIGKQDIWSEAQFRKLRPAGEYYPIDLAAMRASDVNETERLFRLVIDQVSSGAWKPLPQSRFPLSRAAEAFRFMAEARHIGKVVLVEDDLEAAGTEHVVSSGAYLVTGGLSGLGLLTAGRLVSRGARNVVLVGRHGPSDHARVAIAAMEADGATVTVIQADMAQPKAVSDVLATIAAGPAPLRGIVLSAGALNDGALVQQTWDRFAEPLGAKLDGAWALHTMTQHARLDFFIMYSSIASVLGSAGQANHAAANAFMDALAQHRRARGLAALSVSWGAWEKVGAAAERNLAERVGARGIGMIEPEQGLLALERLSRGTAPHVAVFPVRWNQFLQGSAASRPFFSRVEATQLTTRAAGATALPVVSVRLMADIQAAMPAKRRELLLTFVAEHVARVIGAPDWRAIDPRQPLNEIGLDSLMSVDLRNRLGAGLGLARTLPATLVFDQPTIEALATYLTSKLPGVGKLESTKSTVNHDTIDDLSEEEVERLFAQKTRS